MVDFMDDSAADIASPTIPGILLSGHFQEHFGYRVKRPNGTQDWLITYTLSGEGVFKIGNNVRICKAGDMILLAPGTPHHYATMTDSVWDFVWAHFLPLPHWAGLLQLPKVTDMLYGIQIDDADIGKRIENAFERIIKDCRGRNAYWSELSLTALEEVLLLANRQHWKDTKPVYDSRIEQVLHILTHRMAEAHTVEELAQQVRLSPSRLAHVFKQQVGDSIMNMLNKLRLREAARYLRFTSRLVSDIAKDVGFADPFYFTRQFTAFFGMSPTAYREREQEKE